MNKTKINYIIQILTDYATVAKEMAINAKTDYRKGYKTGETDGLEYAIELIKQEMNK